MNLEKQYYLKIKQKWSLFLTILCGFLFQHPTGEGMAVFELPDAESS